MGFPPDRFLYLTEDEVSDLIARDAKVTGQPSPSTPTEPTASAAGYEKTLQRLFPVTDWSSYETKLSEMAEALAAAYLENGAEPTGKVIVEYLLKCGVVHSSEVYAALGLSTYSSEVSGFRRSLDTSSDTPESDSSSLSPEQAWLERVRSI